MKTLIGTFWGKKDANIHQLRDLRNETSSRPLRMTSRKSIKRCLHAPVDSVTRILPTIATMVSRISKLYNVSCAISYENDKFEKKLMLLYTASHVAM